MQKTLFFPGILSLYVYYLPTSPPPTSIHRYIQLTDTGWPLDSNNRSHHMQFNIQGLSPTLSTHFEPLYTNMYHIGPSDGAVSRYSVRVNWNCNALGQRRHLLGVVFRTSRPDFLITWGGAGYLVYPDIMYISLCVSVNFLFFDFMQFFSDFP